MERIPLSQSKRRWAQNRKVALRGTRLNYNAGLQEKYQKQLNKLVAQMTKEILNEVTKLFKQPDAKAYFKQQKEAGQFAQDASLSSQARILMNSLSNKFAQLFGKKATFLAKSMWNGQVKSSKTSLHGSLEKLSGGLSLKTGVIPKGMEDVGKAIIEANVSLIKSIPQEHLKNVTGAVMRSITTGRGIADLVPEIQKFNGEVSRRTRNIALDQTRKAYNSINKERMQSIGVKQFEWIHSGGGQFPRASHLKLDGKIFSFENLYKEQEALGVPKADQGIPGEAINCRCTMVPIIKFED